MYFIDSHRLANFGLQLSDNYLWIFDTEMRMDLDRSQDHRPNFSFVLSFISVFCFWGGEFPPG